MSNLEIIYFCEKDGIYPFIKKCDDNYNGYYKYKKMDKMFNDEEEKKLVLFGLSFNKYCSLLEDGFSYEDVNCLLDKGIDKLMSYKSKKGIEWIMVGKSALKCASLSRDEDKCLTKCVKRA